MLLSHEPKTLDQLTGCLANFFMKKCTLLLISSTLLACNCFAQLYIAPVAGYQLDVANNKSFHQINTGIQISMKMSRRYEMILRIQTCLSKEYHYSDSSFTPDPLLPLYEPAYKNIDPQLWYFSFDQRFILNPKNKKQLFSFLLRTGFNSQVLMVSYQYDKTHYVILNPDRTLKASNFFIGAGIEYMRLFKDNRLFVQLAIDSPPAYQGKQYPSSFSFIAPLSLNIGYSFLLQKKKHEK